MPLIRPLGDNFALVYTTCIRHACLMVNGCCEMCVREKEAAQCA